MLKELILIRHGVTDWNQQNRAQGQADIPLNAEGRTQAEKLARRMQRVSLDALYSSDLRRAAETARALRPEPVFDPAWREIALGDLEGVSGDVVPKEFSSFLSWVAAGHHTEGGESFDALTTRVVAGYERLHERHPGGTVAVVSHGGVLKTLIVHLMGMDRTQVGRFSLARNTGVTAFDFHTGAPRLTLLNDASHL